MPGKRVTQAQRETALVVAAGGSITEAAEVAGVSRDTVRRVLRDSDAGAIARLASQKRAEAHKVVLEALRDRSERIMTALGDVPLISAKDVQAAATALRIMADDHIGPVSATGGRFGTEEPFDTEVVETAERITRRYRR